MKPTESELEVLQLLWSNGPSSVRWVNEQLNENKKVGYTTTLKIMQIMLEKGLVTRDDSKRSHIYAAALNQNKTQKSLLNTFVDRAFSGSNYNLVLQALGNIKPSKTELDELKAIIKKMEDDTQS